MTERNLIPPHDAPAELSLLAAILSGGRTTYATVGAWLTDEDFYDPRRGRVWGAARRLDAKSSPIDLSTLDGELAKDGEARDVLTDAFERYGFNHGGVVDNAKRILAKSRQRRMLMELQRLTNEGYKSDDPDAFLESVEASVFALSNGRTDTLLKPINEVCHERMSEIVTLHQDGKTPGVSSGFRNLDLVIGTLRPKRMVVLGGRPGMGKSALASNIATHVAKAGNRVAIFSMEMTALDWTDRMIADDANIDSRLIEMSGHQRQVYGSLETIGMLPIHICDEAGITTSQMRSECRRLKAAQGLSLIIVDYLQLARAEGRVNSKEAAVAVVSQGLLAMAKSLGVCVLALAQLNRDCEKRDNKRPQMSDLRQSGQIEQDAHVITFVYRDAVYNEKAEKEAVELAVVKNRGGAMTEPGQPLRFKFEAKYTRFVEERMWQAGGNEFSDARAGGGE